MNDLERIALKNSVLGERRSLLGSRSQWVVICTLALMGSGCSLAFMNRPPSEDTVKKKRLKPKQIRCTGNYAAPIGDFLLGVVSFETVLLPLIFIPSAIYGLKNASNCNSYVDGTANVYDELRDEPTAHNTPSRTPSWEKSADNVPLINKSIGDQQSLSRSPGVSAPTIIKNSVQKTPKIFCEGRPNGAFCDDGNLCTQGDRCKTGRCFGQPVSCNDDLPCTRDSCEPDRGCVHRPQRPCCGDGERTPLEACDDGNRVADDGCSSTCTIEVILRRLDTRDVEGRYLSRHGDAQAQAEAFCRAAYYDDWAAQIPDSFETGEGYTYSLDALDKTPKVITGPIQRHVQCRLPKP